MNQENLYWNMFQIFTHKIQAVISPTTLIGKDHQILLGRIILLINLSKKNLKSLGIFTAALTILGTIISLDVNAYFHPEAALLIAGGAVGYTLIVSGDKSLAYRISEGAVFFGWLGLLIAWTHIAYNGFYDFSTDELGVAVAYSIHPLLYGFIIKLFSLAFED